MINWKTAIHEAGHAAATIALGGKVTRISMGPEGGGLAYLECNNATDEAISTAAGDIAEEILADTPSPVLELESSEPPTPRILPDILVEDCRTLIAAKDAARCRETVPDAVFLARWAIAGCEDEPDRWADRIAFVNHVASKIVADHREEIIRIATSLFQRQTLFKDEILAAFHNSQEPKEIN